MGPVSMLEAAENSSRLEQFANTPGMGPDKEFPATPNNPMSEGVHSDDGRGPVSRFTATSNARKLLLPKISCGIVPVTILPRMYTNTSAGRFANAGTTMSSVPVSMFALNCQLMREDKLPNPGGKAGPINVLSPPTRLFSAVRENNADGSDPDNSLWLTSRLFRDAMAPTVLGSGPVRELLDRSRVLTAVHTVISDGGIGPENEHALRTKADRAGKLLRRDVGSIPVRRLPPKFSPVRSGSIVVVVVDELVFGSAPVNILSAKSIVIKGRGAEGDSTHGGNDPENEFPVKWRVTNTDSISKDDGIIPSNKFPDTSIVVSVP